MLSRIWKAFFIDYFGPQKHSLDAKPILGLKIRVNEPQGDRSCYQLLDVLR